eukprot:8294891-Pyramimonas_sp.AAC.1
MPIYVSSFSSAPPLALPIPISQRASLLDRDRPRVHAAANGEKVEAGGGRGTRVSDDLLRQFLLAG